MPGFEYVAVQGVRRLRRANECDVLTDHRGLEFACQRRQMSQPSRVRWFGTREAEAHTVWNHDHVAGTQVRDPHRESAG